MSELQTSEKTLSATDDILARMADELKHQTIAVDVSSSMAVAFGTGGLKGIAKIDVAKELLTGEAHRRAAVGPLFALRAFADSSWSVIEQGRALEDVLTAITRLEPEGGTKLGLAIAEGITGLVLNPSPAGINHFVVVTDAEDRYTSGQAHYDANRAREAGITIDIILICQQSNTATTAEKELRILTANTNGRFVLVSDAEAMRTAFRALVSRNILLLGA